MKKIAGFIVILVFSALSLHSALDDSALIDGQGNEYKRTLVEFNLMGLEYTNVTIGFRDANGEDLDSIDLTNNGIRAESKEFIVFWEIVSSATFDLYLKGTGALTNSGQTLGWNLESVNPDGSSGSTYINGISNPEAYSTGGLLHNHNGADFRDNGEQRIRIITDNSFSLPMGGFSQEELIIEIVST